MRILPLLAAVSAFVCSPALALTSSDTSPIEGHWLTQNERSVIEIKQCDEGLCGKIHWIIEGGLQKDIHNDDAQLKDRPMCGLKIMWGFEKESETYWDDGTIYKADDGDVYDAYVQLLDDGRLKLRGYMGITLLGKTQYWTRLNDLSSYPKCK